MSIFNKVTKTFQWGKHTVKMETGEIARQAGGAVLLADIFGATPSNVARQLTDGVHTKLITGVNLPMLLRAVTYQHEPLDALMARALQGGSQGVQQVTQP